MSAQRPTKSAKLTQSVLATVVIKSAPQAQPPKAAELAEGSEAQKVVPADGNLAENVRDSDDELSPFCESVVSSPAGLQVTRDYCSQKALITAAMLAEALNTLPRRTSYSDRSKAYKEGPRYEVEVCTSHEQRKAMISMQLGHPNIYTGENTPHLPCHYP